MHVQPASGPPLTEDALLDRAHLVAGHTIGERAERAAIAVPATTPLNPTTIATSSRNVTRQPAPGRKKRLIIKLSALLEGLVIATHFTTLIVDRTPGRGKGICGITALQEAVRRASPLDQCP